jgi:hypothetical protein
MNFSDVDSAMLISRTVLKLLDWVFTAIASTQRQQICIDSVNTPCLHYGMDVYFILNGVTFVWNKEKARINPINHDGVTFQQAAEAFFDPLLLVVMPVAMKRRARLLLV